MEIYHPTINPFLRGPSIKSKKFLFRNVRVKKTGQYLIEYYPSLSINQSYHVFFLLLFQFDVTSILYRPHWHAQYQARSNDIYCNFHFELSVVLYFIPCNFETRSLGQRFGFVILQICIVFIVSLSSTWKTIYICVVCLFIWVSCCVFFLHFYFNIWPYFLFSIFAQWVSRIFIFYFSVLESTTQCWFFSPSILSWWPHYITSLVMRNYIGKKVVLWTSVFSITCWAMDWPIFIFTIGSEWIHYWLKIENHYNMWQPWFDKVVSIWYWLWKMWFYCG